MDLRQLEAFVAIARLRSYAAAAERLHVTSSALSTRIDGLELEVERPLFERAGRSIAITPWGSELLPHAERMVALAQAMRSTARSRPKFLGNRVRIGTTDSFLRSTLLPIMERFGAAYPRVAIDLTVGDSNRVWDLLLTGEVDAAFLSDPALVPGIKVVPVSETRMIWVAARQFTFRSTDVREALSQCRIFTSPPGSIAYSAVAALSANLGIRDPVICGIGSLEAAIRFCVAGLGVGMLTEGVAAPYLQTGALVEILKEVELPQLRYFACHRVDTLSDAGAIFVSYVTTEKPTQGPEALAIFDNESNP
jgi:DNA-binding transcriptional LysR family regulator